MVHFCDPVSLTDTRNNSTAKDESVVISLGVKHDSLGPNSLLADMQIGVGDLLKKCKNKQGECEYADAV